MPLVAFLRNATTAHDELAESGSLQLLLKRLQDVKQRRVKGLTERDLADYLRKRQGPR